jgi:hypothetical protein
MIRKAATITTMSRTTTPAMMPPIAPPLRPPPESLDGEFAATLGTLVGMNFAATPGVSMRAGGGVGVVTVTVDRVDVMVSLPDVVVMVSRMVVVTGSVE